jgi:8-oxo-dGTP pyrophosphatase MutT (NUDIX family)/predicted GNAT family acetyltransferase
MAEVNVNAPLTTAPSSATPYTARPRKTATDENLVVAGVIITTRNGNALFLKRNGSGAAPNVWCWPGGGLESGEDAETAAIRETREETGWIVDGPMHKLDQRQLDGVDFTTFETMAGNEFIPELNDEHVGWAWAPLDNPPQPLHPGCKKTLDMAALGMDADFKEGDHPRAPDGKFGSGGSNKVEPLLSQQRVGKLQNDIVSKFPEMKYFKIEKTGGPVKKQGYTESITFTDNQDQLNSRFGFAHNKNASGFVVNIGLKNIDLADIGIRAKDRGKGLAEHITKVLIENFRDKKIKVNDDSHGFWDHMIEKYPGKIAKDVAANQATESELRSVIKYPPEKGNGTRAINVAMENGGAGKTLKSAPEAKKFAVTGKTEDCVAEDFSLTDAATAALQSAIAQITHVSNPHIDDQIDYIVNNFAAISGYTKSRARELLSSAISRRKHANDMATDVAIILDSYAILCAYRSR